jgi:catechol 2,3-dioxygenase-like lactoylglutathione lyase family enzyme
VIDHVAIRVGDLDEARAFYSLALALLDGPGISEGDRFIEWNDFSIAQATNERPLTRRLHIGFQAADRVQVDAWWQTLRDAGHSDLGAPGPRPEYTPAYYGAFIADPAGNSIEAVHKQPRRTDGTTIDHVWLRVRNLQASTRFYTAVAPTVGYQVRTRQADRTTLFQADAAIISLVPGQPTENVHIAFAAHDAVTVDAFHQAGLTAGYTSLGPPGERPEYHPGYYAAYLADPDLNNIEAVHHNHGNEIDVSRQLDDNNVEAVFHDRPAA